MLTDFRDADGTIVPASVYYDALCHTHQRRVRARVMDLDHNILGWLPDILDGQVTINTSRESQTTRVANVTLFDPSQSIEMEPNSPSALPRHLKRMIQIIDERAIPGYGWVGCSVFTGPVAEVDRAGAEVRLAAKGKDVLAMRSFGRSHHWKKGRKITAVIREILELSGEKPSRIHLPNLPNTIRAKDGFSVSRTDRPLAEARKLARALDRVIFYDGRGHLVMRKQPTTPAQPRLDANWLMGPVRMDRQELPFKNGWIVLGPKPGGDKPRATSGLIGLPKNHPLSAYQLRRNGKWGWEILQLERPHAKTNADARKIALRFRDNQVRLTADVSLDMLPLPNIEEYDLLRAVDPLTGHVDVRVQQATIPLVGGNQTIGSTKRVTVPRRRR